MQSMTSPARPISDLELLPPLESVKNPRDHAFLHPLLCRLFCSTKILKLSNDTRFTSLVLLHRYFDALDSNVDPTELEWKWIAAACLFLGTKTEEESRRIRDVLNVAFLLDFGIQNSIDSSLQTTIVTIKDKPMLLDEEYWKAKDKLIKTEQNVLRMLRFNVTVSHPHRAVAVLLEQEEFSDRQRLLPECWKWINQALFHAPALTFDVLTIACASIECASALNNSNTNNNISNGIPWWYKYGVSYTTLEECKKQLLQAATSNGNTT